MIDVLDKEGSTVATFYVDDVAMHDVDEAKNLYYTAGVIAERIGGTTRAAFGTQFFTENMAVID